MVKLNCPTPGVLMGASVGARASTEATASSPPGVSAVITLSAEQTVRSDPTDLARPARRDRIPTLLIGARQDPLNEGFAPVLLRAVGSRDKQAPILPGLDHGTALLTGENGPRVRASIFGFVSRSTHPPRSNAHSPTSARRPGKSAHQSRQRHRALQDRGRMGKNAGSEPGTSRHRPPAARAGLEGA